VNQMQRDSGTMKRAQHLNLEETVIRCMKVMTSFVEAVEKLGKH